MGLTHAYGEPMDPKEAEKVLLDALEAGYTFFDMAENYTGEASDGKTFYNEELIGNVLSPYRDKIQIATKFEVKIAPDHSLILDSKPKTIRKSYRRKFKKA